MNYLTPKPLSCVERPAGHTLKNHAIKHAVIEVEVVQKAGVEHRCAGQVNNRRHGDEIRNVVELKVGASEQ